MNFEVDSFTFRPSEETGTGASVPSGTVVMFNVAPDEDGVRHRIGGTAITVGISSDAAEVIQSILDDEAERILRDIRQGGTGS